jgi:predicted ATPase
MLKKLELHNFKSHRHTQFDFDDSRLHAIVGQNSSGKTSVLQAIDCFGQLVDASFRDVFVFQKRPEFITTFGEKKFCVRMSGHEKNNWVIDYSFIKDDNELWHPVPGWPLQGDIQLQSEAAGNYWPVSLKSAPDFLRAIHIQSVAYVKLLSTNLAKSAYSEELIPEIQFDGSGLSPALDYLRSEAPERFQTIQEMLQQIVPSVRKIGVRRAKVTINRQRSIEVDGKSISYEENQEVTGQEIVLDMNTGDRIPAHAISEGTMLTLGLLTVLMNPKQPNLVLLDDIEQGLHPKAQRELITVFKQIIQANPNLQIIFTTHSPYIIDELQPSQVHVLSNSKAGFTHVKRLDEHPDAAWAKQTLTTGEFWNAEGEDWVVDGKLND